MFNRLSDLRYRRTPEEALGFYLVTAGVLFATMIVLGPLMQFTGALGHTPQQARLIGSVVSLALGILYCVTLGFMVAVRKRMDALYTAGFIILAAAAAVAHGVVGLFVVAYMTTCPVDWPSGIRKRQAAEARAKADAREAAMRRRRQAANPSTAVALIEGSPAPSPPPETTSAATDDIAAVGPAVPPFDPNQKNVTIVSQAARKPTRLRPDLVNDEPVDDLMQ